MARTLEGNDVPFLSAAIRDCRESLIEMYPDGVDAGREAIQYANELMRAWEAEARNLENRVVGLIGYHRPLGDGEVFQARPGEISSRVVPMTPEEIAQRDALRGAA